MSGMSEAWAVTTLEYRRERQVSGGCSHEVFTPKVCWLGTRNTWSLIQTKLQRQQQHNIVCVSVL